jgi:polyisoprenyl-teichoic acid--peptidoglycan teichoic acid transferase
MRLLGIILSIVAVLGVVCVVSWRKTSVDFRLSPSFSVIPSAEKPDTSANAAESKAHLSSTTVIPIDEPVSTDTIKLIPLLKAALSEPSGSNAAIPENLLIAGVPGKGNPAPNLTDSVLVAHLDGTRGKAVIFSLPRDLLVRAPDASYYTKLNALFERGGATALRLKAQDITGLEINRYAIVDLDAVQEIVDELGGVNIYVEKPVYDPKFPGDNFSYETFSIKAGWRFMDGDTATKYVRTRNDAEGDFGRMRRQQQLIEALRQKIAGLSFVWDMPKFLKIYDSIRTHVSTNLKTDELMRLYRWSKAVTPENMIIAPLDADKEKDLFTTGNFMFGDSKADIVKPIAGIEEYSGIHAYIEDVIAR